MSDIQDIILHWYPHSPFAQKVAWVLNYKKVEYKTVLIPMLEPRQKRRPLDGGYRKTPILQIGNHVYCDSKAIFLALEKLFPEPSLYPKIKNSNESSEGAARALTMWMDNTLFNNIVSQLPVKDLDDAFLADREALAGRKLDRKTLAGGAPFMKATLQGEFALAEQTLGSKNWLLDTETPSLADISLAMSTFFTLNLAGEKFVQTNFKSLFNHMQKLLGTVSWDRTETMSVISEEEAIEVLKRHQDTEIEANFKVHSSVLPIELGQQVFVTPLDTGKIPVPGTLIRSTIDETVVAYKDATYNTTTLIHFPTIGFVVIPNLGAKY
ncbi:thioredoxin-like protein [Mucor mucedo]|uniref:thioredoxin-like protein n=1 Tax=Mucor mucedo TaxID=29922 RepID=UPI002220D5C3|nr:thioredoxin-like protein [Mucor mucedo]KAI7887865.1 thioredoxin-like protein [Mucor mucedo]